jgi:hypothetical protein
MDSNQKKKVTLNNNNENEDSRHIFIIWETSRGKSKEVLELMRKKFEIITIYEISWKKELFIENIRRFYGATLPDPTKKANLCGFGSFLLVLVIDHSPKFEKRGTSYGPQLVNSRVYDEKFVYRKLIGGDYPIHGSNTEKETNHDLTLLLGKNLPEIFDKFTKKWDGRIEKIKKDILGFDGWKNLEELFYVLNNTTEYLVLRNFEKLYEEPTSTEHRDIDILTDDLWQIPYIVNKKNFKINEKNVPRVKINGKLIAFDFRYPGDHYYDKKWASNMLKERILNNGIYTPKHEDYLHSLIYHMLIHKKKISNDYINKIKKTSKNVGINLKENLLNDEKYLKKILNKFMISNNYQYTNSWKYKTTNNESTRLIMIAIKIAKKRGMKSFLKAVKGKLYRNQLIKSGQI